MIGAPDSAFEMRLGLTKGTQWGAPPPYPEVVIENAKETHVRRIVLQDLVVNASEPETEDSAYIHVQRLVAELEGGEEIELSRITTPAKQENAPALPSNVCRACETPIVSKSETVIVDGEPYHKRCVE